MFTQSGLIFVIHHSVFDVLLFYPNSFGTSLFVISVSIPFHIQYPVSSIILQQPAITVFIANCYIYEYKINSMKKSLLLAIVLGFSSLTMLNAQQSKTSNTTDNKKWSDLFAKDLSDAEFPAGIWTFTDGILTASEDQCIWTKKDFRR